MFGLSEQCGRGQNISALLPEITKDLWPTTPNNPADDSESNLESNGAFSADSLNEKETTARRVDGTTFPARLHIVLLTTDKETLYALFLHDLTERKIIQDSLEKLAYVDRQTGVPNFAGFMRDTRYAIEIGHKPAVMLIDLDRFWMARTSFGHEIADRILSAFIARLCDSLPPECVVGRLHQERLGVLIPTHGSLERIEEPLYKIRHILSHPFDIDHRITYITANIGIAVTGNRKEDAADVIRNAEIAAYQARIQGRDMPVLFDAEMHARLVDRQQMETDLRRAIFLGGELRLAYQPIIEMESGRLVGFEALARWRSPRRGWISPVDFIPLAEEAGLIVPLGNHVFLEACRRIVAWQKFRPTNTPPLFMSINLSAGQLNGPALTTGIRRMLEVTGADPAWIRLEITESGLMNNQREAISTLHQVRDIGIGLSIDDFGTGYSSLSYLRRLPVDGLKIDRAFVAAMGQTTEDREIVRTIIRLGKIMGFKVIAEGVETIEEMEALRHLRCEYGQGFLFGRPLDPESAQKIIIDGRSLCQATE
ncbi:diguanylate cyclase [Azospirillaceae bacterium]